MPDMRCESCQTIDFSASLMLSEPPTDYSNFDGLSAEFHPTDKTGLYFAQPLHPNIDSLKRTAARGCHLCVQALHALKGIGLVISSNDRRHHGPVEVRWYAHAAKKSASGVVREVYIVAKTGVRDIKGTLELVEFAAEDETRFGDADAASSLGRICLEKAECEPASTGCDANFLLARV
jgi:hypothetical protein